jgi:osmotically-inducible protein OsmY
MPAQNTSQTPTRPPAGPAGRTDAGLAREARDAIAWGPLVPAGIQVTVHEGWLTLSGTVRWEYQRVAAQRAVRGISALAGVTNMIAIRSRTEVEVRVSAADERRR